MGDSQPAQLERNSNSAVRLLAQQALSRAAGGPLVAGNSVRILKDAAQKYPAWLEAIRGAQRTIYFENYIVTDDIVGREFAAALAERAHAGVRVRVIYDWMGGAGRRTDAVVAARYRGRWHGTLL